MVTPSAGEVILVPFPFSDLSPPAYDPRSRVGLIGVVGSGGGFVPCQAPARR